MSDAREAFDGVIETADYLIDCYMRLWRGGIVGDLAEASGSYEAAKDLMAHRLAALASVQPEGWRLTERKHDDECGCPEEVWDTPYGELHMHLAAGRPSNGCLDNGDEGERHIDLTARTVDEARIAIFAWAATPSAPEVQTGTEAMRAALNKIADLGSCAVGKRTNSQLLQEAIDLATGAL